MRCALPTRRVYLARFAGLLAHITATLGVATTSFAQTAIVQAPPVRISQVFPYGGLLASQPRATYVELYNGGTAAVSLTGWTLQVANPVNSIWEPVALSGFIGPRGYYLVQMGQNFTGTALPTPDAGPFNVFMPQDGGKVALVIDSLTIGGRPSCPFPEDIVDLVGWGNADQRIPCSAATPTFNNAPSPSLTTALFRKCGGKADIGSNFDTFTLGTPAPRNTASPANTSVDVSITPITPFIAAYPGETITITASGSSSACAGSTLNASINLGPIGGAFDVPLSSIGGGQYRTTVNLGPLNLAPGSYTLDLSSTVSLISERGSGKVTILIRPPNDDCAAAVGVPTTGLPVTFTVNNDGAQPDVDPGTCTTSSQGDKGVWYTFTPALPGVLRIDQLSAQDAAVGVFQNTCGPTNNVLCAADNSGAVAVLAGSTYKILVVRRNAAQLLGAPLAVRFGFTVVAPNDSACNAVALTLGLGVDSNNTDATSTDDGPSVACTGGSISPVKSVWYSFTPATTGLFRVSTCGSPIDTDLSVFTVAGCPGTSLFTSVASGCDRLACPGSEPGPGPGAGSPDAAVIESVSLTAGTRYFIRVSSAGTSAGGAFRVLVSAIISGACCDSLSGVCAISSTGACPTGQTYLGAGTTCAVGNCVAAPTGACCNYANSTCTILQSGACDNGRAFLGVGSSCTVGICILSNDECANATRVFATIPIVGSTTTATTSAALSLASCGTSNGSDGNDVFFVFSPSVTTIYEISLCGSDFDTTLGVHSGCPATEANRVFCNDDSGLLCNTAAFSRVSRIPTALLISTQTYYIRVAGFNGATGNFNLAVNATGVCCRGTTCTTSLYTPLSCAAVATPLVPTRFVNAVTNCNPTASATFPCCYADFNHNGVIEVQDIFDFLNAWFSGSPYTRIGGDGALPTRIQDIFDFLNLWFTQGC